jgi:hypothetical protein
VDASRHAIAADIIHWSQGAKRLTTSGFSRQSRRQTAFASGLAPDPQRSSRHDVAFLYVISTVFI